MIIKNNLLKNIMSLGIATMVLSQACSPLIVKGTEIYRSEIEVLTGGAIDIEDPNWTDAEQDKNDTTEVQPPVDGEDIDTDNGEVTDKPSYGGDDKGKPNKPSKPVKPNKPSKPEGENTQQAVQSTEEDYEIPYINPELATQQVGAPQRMRLEMPEIIEEPEVTTGESKVQVLLPSEERKVAKTEVKEGTIVTDTNTEKELVVFDSNEGTVRITKSNIIAQNVDNKNDNTYNIIYRDNKAIKQVKVKVDDEVQQSVEHGSNVVESHGKKEKVVANKVNVAMNNKTENEQDNIFVINPEMVEETENQQLSAKQLVQNELSKTNMGAKQSALFGANELILTGLTFTLAGSYLITPSMKRKK